MHEYYNRLHNTRLHHVCIHHVSFKYYIRPFQPQAKVNNDLEAVMTVLDIEVDVMCQCK